MRCLIITLDNPGETERWTAGDAIDRSTLAHGMVAEARAAGAEEVVLLAHDGTELWRWAHGKSVEARDLADELLTPVAQARPRQGDDCRWPDGLCTHWPGSGAHEPLDEDEPQ